MSILKSKGKITGEINNHELDVDIVIESCSGVMKGDITVNSMPKGFSPLAASGLSWLCWENAAIASVSNDTYNLLKLCNGNYDLKRQNKFPNNGGTIDMLFKVRNIGNSLEMKGEWVGNYRLSENIKGVKAPIIERFEQADQGKIKSFYDYIITDSSDDDFKVDTYSTYNFDCNKYNSYVVNHNQQRIMTFSITKKSNSEKFRIITHSVMTRENINQNIITPSLVCIGQLDNI